MTTSETSNRDVLKLLNWNRARILALSLNWRPWVALVGIMLLGMLLYLVASGRPEPAAPPVVNEVASGDQTLLPAPAAADQSSGLDAPKLPAGPAPVTAGEWTSPLTRGTPVSQKKDWGPAGPQIVQNSEVASLASLVADSDRIVVGWVVDQVCRWDDDRTAIYTYYRFAVDRVLKGEVPEAFVIVRVVGGSIPEEDARLTVSHQPRFNQGDKGIVFIDDNPILWTSVSYNQQGFLRFDDRGPDLRLVIDGFNRPVYGLSDDDRFIIEDGHTKARITSTDLEERIQELAG